MAAVSSLARSTIRAYRNGLGALAGSNGVWDGKRVNSVSSRGLFGMSGGNRPRKSQSRVLSGNEGHLFILESKPL